MLLRCWRRAFSQDSRFFGVASRMGGSSEEGLYDLYRDFYNRDLENFKVKAMQEHRHTREGPYALPGVNIVTTEEECRGIVEILMRHPKEIVAWDTETIDLDIKQQAPVGKGRILCASFFAGPQFNFGRGPRVFIDNFGKNAGLIDYFKEYLQSEEHLKVWHNYGFDRHLFYNHGINVRGFGGDTMQMARLYDSGKMFGQYSLAALTASFNRQMLGIATLLPNVLKSHYMRERPYLKNNPQRDAELDILQANLNEYSKYFAPRGTFVKTKMDELFKRKRVLKSGGDGVSYEYPNTLTLHTNVEYLKQWIQYAVLDSETTYYLRRTLQEKLQREKLNIEPDVKNVWQLYQKYWLPFGEILTDIQRTGISVDMGHMRKIEEEAKFDLLKKEEYFLNFLTSFQDGRNIDHFNPSSALQLQQLLFAPCVIKRPPKDQKKPGNKGEQGGSDEDWELQQAVEDSETAYEPATAKTQRKEVNLEELVKVFQVENKFRQKPKKIEMEVMGLCLPYFKTTPLGLPAVDISVIESLAGDPQHDKYGAAFHHFNEKGNPQFGRKLCVALRSLIEYKHIQTLLKTFIEPLQGYVDGDGRIHCSININTETGRLSCRKPNIQNQPALDKDIYKIRKAFVAEKGKKFIVADYGQLELRVLAHLTNCKAMISAFKEGGDFHSRTAIGMYDYIKKEIAQGKVLLQWDKSKGIPPVPLLKDKFAAERKKAKTVNFSIAYGKTARGFATDWNCTLKEAEEVIAKWFSDRPEVKDWQQKMQRIARTKKHTQTLLGRYRKLDRFVDSKEKKAEGMWMRRAINTPIQGGAADIVIAAMINIARNARLKELGWKLLMQIHDELILEGPEESQAEAFLLVKQDMEHPFQEDLKVALEVDAKIGRNWYECK